jgi:hypothetical protein
MDLAIIERMVRALSRSACGRKRAPEGSREAAKKQKAAKRPLARSEMENVKGPHRAELELEAPPGFEPGLEVLQTSALPLGDGASRSGVLDGL